MKSQVTLTFLGEDLAPLKDSWAVNGHVDVKKLGVCPALFVRFQDWLFKTSLCEVSCYSLC